MTTTALKIYPSKLVSWDDVLSRLRSGEYNQTQGAMCRSEGGWEEGYTLAYCPLGIIALLSGAEFELHTSDDNILCDQDGETLVPPQEVLDALNLNEFVTTDDTLLIPEYSASMFFHFGKQIRRWEAISYMNDHVGLKLHKIADEIERLGWNVT